MSNSHEQGSQAQGPPSGWDALTQAFPSANRLVSTVLSTVSILRPLAGPKPAQVLRRGFADLFQTYTNALSANFLKHQQPDGSFPYNLGEEQGQAQPAHAVPSFFALGGPCHIPILQMLSYASCRGHGMSAAVVI